MKRTHRKNGTRTLLLTLVLATAAVNASQSLVLCMGYDGHVAIERAGHHHCTGHAQGSDPADPHSHIADAHCRPCTDIPISLWIREDAGSPGMVKAAAMPVALLSLPHPAEVSSILPELSGSPPPSSCPAPLHSIVLQI